jgi:hypothetical protein
LDGQQVAGPAEPEGVNLRNVRFPEAVVRGDGGSPSQNGLDLLQEVGKVRVVRSIRTFTRSGVDGFRSPFHSDTGVYPLRENYNLEKESPVDLSFKGLAEEIIHASQIMVVHDEPKIGDGLLIASDWHLKNRILLLTIDEFQSFVRTVLEDRIRVTVDSRDFETGKADAIRE